MPPLDVNEILGEATCEIIHLSFTNRKTHLMETTKKDLPQLVASCKVSLMPSLGGSRWLSCSRFPWLLDLLRRKLLINECKPENLIYQISRDQVFNECKNLLRSDTNSCSGLKIVWMMFLLWWSCLSNPQIRWKALKPQCVKVLGKEERKRHFFRAWSKHMPLLSRTLRRWRWCRPP